jgi:hypothetical protein
MASKPTERGAALVEFALIALVLYVILAGMAELGRMIFTAQALQDAARVAARELSVMPLPAESIFDPPPMMECLDYTPEEAPVICRCEVWQRVFNPAQLVIDLDNLPTPPDPEDDPLESFLASLPPVNQALRALMIVDHSTGGNLLRYPGALLNAAPPPPEQDIQGNDCDLPPATASLGVGIPRVTARSGTGVETIEWTPVLAEVRTEPNNPATGPFSITSAGLVSLMLNYPFQAATLTGFRPSAPTPEDPLPPNLSNFNVADDIQVQQTEPPPIGETFPNDPDAVGPYAGPYGLGRQLAFGQTVRPYRRLITAQAIYRREVMQ